MSRHWFFATNPTRYHWDTLFVKGKDLWDGLRGSRAERYLRQVRKGDKVVCYHGPPDRLVYALALAASDAYLGSPLPRRQRRYIIDLKAVQGLPRPLPLKELKANRSLRRMKFLGQLRLAVTPLSLAEYQEILRMAGLRPELFP
ncbi:MAG: EVE domain-containing protein [Terriglobia bacterium]